MLVIGIAGGSGSGKTTVAQAIVSKLGDENVALISQDSYYKNFTHLPFEERKDINYDHPDSVDNQLLLNHLDQLRRGQAIEVPIYDFSQHARTCKTTHVPVKPVVVIEGILILSDRALREQMDIKVFVDTDPDVRILRRVMRDINERGRSLESVYDQYLTTVKPMHEAFVEPSKRYSDLIIPEGGHNEIAIDLLTSLLERYMSAGAKNPLQ
ncbi:uridine kinase [Effusibacillus lacus]|uniref:Uridine kinase n=1 Tax=Effusibacillus lacus TaxID=1348429 RepID=A0A292YN24_9BACL|nr:uridine kinase [Effusibacillus lacus]TCS75361.1 uridine kinase [Effusibacillus lacus]GAX89794.1 uridine kinase [Effusibacillus lacus]